VRPVTSGVSAVRWCARARRHSRCTHENLVGTYSGKGNGDDRDELTSALQAIATYLKQVAFSSAMALVRLDGQ
jgi:hypothetical protein